MVISDRSCSVVLLYLAGVEGGGKVIVEISKRDHPKKAIYCFVCRRVFMLVLNLWG